MVAPLVIFGATIATIVGIPLLINYGEVSSTPRVPTPPPVPATGASSTLAGWISANSFLLVIGLFLLIIWLFNRYFTRRKNKSVYKKMRGDFYIR